MNRRPTEPKGKPLLRVRLDNSDKLPSQNRLAVTLKRAARDAESIPAREPSQAKLDSAARMQGLESRAAREAMRARRANPTERERAAMSASIGSNPTEREREMMLRGMEGFRDSTRTRYMQGGDVEAYAKGGKVKGAAKISKVMGEFKRGELHSGSKKGPKVTSEKQAKAIALSEARAAGAKIPAPKKRGVPVASREPIVKAAGGLVGRPIMPHLGGKQPPAKPAVPVMPVIKASRPAPLQRRPENTGGPAAQRLPRPR